MSNVSGLKFTVQKSFAGVQLVEDEWYPCILTEIKQDKSTFNGVESDILVWNFELQNEEARMEFKDGTVKQFSVRGRTSLFTTPKSKMYVWYTKLIGKELEEGDSIDLDNIIGSECFIMVKPKEYIDRTTQKTKVAYNVERIKPKDKVAPKVAPKVVTKPATSNPGGITKAEELPDDPTASEPKVESAPKKVFSKIDI